MELPRPRNRLLGSILLATFVVVVPLLVYVVVIQRNQQAYFEGRNHRVLASVAAEVRGYADTLPFIKKTHEHHKSVPRFLYKDDPEAAAAQLASLRARDQAALRAVPAFRRLRITDEPRQCDKTKKVKSQEAAAKAAGAKLDLGIPQTPDPVQVKIFHRGRDALIGRRWCVNPDGHAGETDDAHILRSVLLRLDDAVAKAVWEDAFDGVLLANAKGVVIWQAPDTFPRFRSIVPPPASEGAQPADPLPLASDSRVVEVGDGPVRLFHYPAQLGSDDWLLVGFVTERRFAADVRRPSPLVLAVALGILLVGMVSWPFFKLWTVGPGQHLSRAETLGVGIALVVNSGLLALLVVGGQLHRGAGERLDATARTLAVNLRAEFSRELSAALDCAGQLLHPQHGAGGCPGSAFRETSANLFEWNWPAGPAPAAYPPLDLAFTVDADAQRWPRQWISRVVKQPHVSMGDRGYFRRVRDGELWVHEGKDRRRFALERIRARNQGVALSALAVPVPQGARLKEEAGTPEVALVLVRRFHSLWSATFPAEFRFAVIENETGLVLYHSEDERSLVENLYDESGTGAALRSAALFGDERALQGRYHGVRHRYWVEPLAPMPWSLVILRNRDLLDEVMFDVFVTSVAHLGAAALLLGVVLLAMHGLRPGGLQLVWMAPQERLRHRYVAVAAVLGALVLGCGLAIHRIEGATLLAFPVLMPLAVFPLLALANRSQRATPRAVPVLEILFGGALLALGAILALSFEGIEAWLPPLFALLFVVTGLAVRFVRVGTRRYDPVPGPVLARYRMVVLLVMFSVGVVPSLAVLKDALGRAGVLLARHAEVEYGRALDARDARVKDDTQRLQPFPFGEPGLAARMALPIGASPAWPTLPGLRTDPKTAGPNGGMADCDDSLWPRFGTGVLAKLIHPYGDHAGRVRRAACADRTGQGWRVHVEPPPTLRWPGADPGVWAAFGLLVVFVGVVSWIAVQELARAVFAVDVRDPVRGADALTPGQLAVANRILIRPPQSWLEWRIPALEWAFEKSMVLVDALAEPEWPRREDARSEALDSLRLLVVKNADLLFHAPVRRNRLLRILESLVTHEHGGAPHALLVCERSPAELILAPRSGAETVPGVRPEERERWRRVFARFTEGPGFEPTLPDWRAEGTEETRILLRECAWWDALEPLRGEVARELHARSAAGGLGGRGEVEAFIVRQVAERASHLYRGLWGLCSREERAVLLQLAQGQLVSPASHGALESLVARGLVKRDPDLRPVCRSLAEFVVSQPPDEDVRVWQKDQADHAAWGWIRLPLAAGLAVVAGYFLWSGRGDVLTAQLGVVSAVVAGAAPVLRLLFGSSVPQVPGQPD